MVPLGVSQKVVGVGVFGFIVFTVCLFVFACAVVVNIARVHLQSQEHSARVNYPSFF